MKINITKKKGIKLLTKGHKVEEDIVVGVDSSLFPSGETEITENGTYDVYDKETAVVNVPIPDGYIQPSGTLEITENGSYNIADKASATVNVQSGLTINGIIEQYKVQAGKTVNAGDFVEFINAVSWGSGTFNSGAVGYISACKLTNNKILVAYQDGGNSSYGTAVVLKATDTEIKTETALVFNGSTTSYISTTKLTENKVLVAYKSSQGGQAVVLNVEDTTITAGSVKTYDSNADSYVSVVALNENKGLVGYRDSSWYGKVMVLNINEMSITTGTATTFESTETEDINVLKLNENKALVVYEASTRGAIVLTISGTTISKGTAVEIESVSNMYTTAVVLNENKVVVAYYSDYTKPKYGYAKVLSIDGTTITVGQRATFISGATSSISIAKLTETKVLIAFYYSYRRAVILTIDGTTITVGTPITFDSTTTSTSMSVVAFSSTSAVVFYNSSGGYYKGLTIDGTTITPNTTTQNETLVLPSETVINGIANTSGTDGKTVEIYVPTPKGYTVTLSVSGYEDGGSFDYATDNGLTGTVNYQETVTLEKVSSITISNALVGMGGFEVNGSFDVITDVYGETTLEITENTTITLNVYGV